MSRLLVVFLIVGGLLASPRWGAAAAESDVPGAPRLLPEDTLAYIRIDNVDQLREDLAGSSMGRMMADPALRPLASDIYRTMGELFEQISDQLGVTLDELLAIPDGQVALAAMPGNPPEEQDDQVQEDAGDESPEAIRRRIARKRREQNSIAGLFVIQSGEHLDTLQGIVDRIEQKLLQTGYVRRTSVVAETTLVKLLPPRAGRPEIEYFVREQTLIFGIGSQTASKALDHWLQRSQEPTLADRSDFTSVMSRCVGAEDTQPQITFFVDPYHIVQRLVKRGGAAALVWPIIEDLGLAKIRGIGGSVFRGGDVFDDISHLHVLIDPPRDGFFGVLRPETGDTQPPNWVPSDVTSYTSIYWDFPVTFDNAGKVMAKFGVADPTGRLEDWTSNTLDISFREDVLPLLAGRYVTCRWSEPPVKLNSQTQLHAFSLSDAVAATSVLAKIRDRRPNDIDVETINGVVVYSAKRRPGRAVPQGLRQPDPCLMVLGDWLVFADSCQFLERATLASTGTLPRLSSAPEYELVSSELGGKLDGEKPFLLSFLRSAVYVEQFYELAKSDDSRQYLRKQGEKNPLSAKMAEMLSRNQLPPFEQFKKYFAPSGSFAYDEPSGMHIGSFTLKAEE